MLNESNTVFAEAVRYMQQVFFVPNKVVTQTTSLSLQPFLRGSLGDRPTDHITRSVTIRVAHSGEAKFGYGLWLQQVFI